MRMSTNWCKAAAFAIMVIWPVGVLASVEDDARGVIDARKSAVVTVQIVTETTSSYEGETDKTQSKTTATATVIDPSGLVVTSLTAVNPRDRFHDLMMGMNDDSGYTSSTIVVDAKIRLDDGTEIPADVVLRDRDLDLAFLRPKEAPKQPLSCVDLSQSTAPQVMDNVVALSRLGQVANRALAASLQRVSATLTKPRKAYCLDTMSSIYGMGEPVFALDGKAVGILVLRASMSRDQGDDDSGPLEYMLPVVLPCSTVLKAAEHAKTAAPEKEAAAK